MTLARYKHRVVFNSSNVSHLANAQAVARLRIREQSAMWAAKLQVTRGSVLDAGASKC